MKTICCAAGSIYAVLAFCVAVMICPYVVLAGVFFMVGEAAPDMNTLSGFGTTALQHIFAAALYAGYPIIVLTSIGAAAYQCRLVIFSCDNVQKSLYKKYVSNAVLSCLCLPLLPFVYLLTVLGLIFCISLLFVK